jgi:hypothetical protein
MFMSRFGCPPYGLATMGISTLGRRPQAEQTSCETNIPQSVREVLRIADAAQQRGHRNMAIKCLDLVFDLLDSPAAVDSGTPA